MVATTLGFALPVYLGLKGGGYDVVVRSEVGIAVWWTLAIGVLSGALALPRMTRAGLVGVVALVLLAGWTAATAIWSESGERSMLEAGRTTTYAGVFALGLLACAHGHARHVIAGLSTGIVVIAAVGVASRLHPAWFPADVSATADFLPTTQSRLAYPLNYWNGVAALVALAVPLVIWWATFARTATARALAAAAVPLLGLCWYLTLSRGGAAAIAVGCIALLALAPRRVTSLVTMALGVAGSAILATAVDQRGALADGLATEAARSQGDEVLLMLLVVCAGVGLLRLGMALAELHGLLPAGRPAARRTRAIVAAALVAGVVAVGAASAGSLSSSWESFKNPAVTEVAEDQRTSARFSSVSGNGRYQYWASAVDAVAERPLGGIGAGTFELWWARHATVPGFVRNAHSLYFEALAETGIIGIALLLALMGAVLAGGLARIRRSAPADAALAAAALAACAAFATSAAVDWVWQVAAIPACAMLLAAAVLFPGRGQAAPSRRLSTRVAIAALAVPALVAIAIPLAGTVEVRKSQAAAQRADLPTALTHAEAAARVQPYAVTPELQRALVLEAAGNLPAAAAAARAAERREPTNWRLPLVLARIETQRGAVPAAVEALRRARDLNKASVAAAR